MRMSALHGTRFTSRTYGMSISLAHVHGDTCMCILLPYIAGTTWRQLWLLGARSPEYMQSRAEPARRQRRPAHRATSVQSAAGGVRPQQSAVRGSQSAPYRGPGAGCAGLGRPAGGKAAAARAAAAVRATAISRRQRGPWGGEAETHLAGRDRWRGCSRGVGAHRRRRRRWWRRWRRWWSGRLVAAAAVLMLRARWPWAAGHSIQQGRQRLAAA